MIRRCHDLDDRAVLEAASGQSSNPGATTEFGYDDALKFVAVFPEIVLDLDQGLFEGLVQAGGYRRGLDRDESPV